MSTPIPILLVHRNELERSALKAAFEALPNVQIAGERPDLRAGIALAHQTRPAILRARAVGRRRTTRWRRRRSTSWTTRTWRSSSPPT